MSKNVFNNHASLDIDPTERVAQELNSKFGSGLGPSKSITRISLQRLEYHVERRQLCARIRIYSHCTGMHDDDWDSHIDFRLTEKSVGELALSPRFALFFARVHKKMTREYKLKITEAPLQGTDRKVPVFKERIRLKRMPGVK